MTILSIDTSTRVCSAAIAVDGKTIASRINREDGNHARQLPVFVDELLAELRSRKLSLDAVALSEGPGSYTGLRIGAGIAKGLCYGLNIPLVPIATTEVLCASLLTQKALLQPCYLIPMIDARRMEVYTAFYRYNDDRLTLQSAIEARVISSAADIDFGQSPDEPVYFFGDGAAKCEALIPSKTAGFIDNIVPDAASMDSLALEHYKADSTRRTPTELAYYEPFYLKQFVAAQSHVKGLN